jgi:hypothetical protein
MITQKFCQMSIFRTEKKEDFPVCRKKQILSEHIFTKMNKKVFG